MTLVLERATYRYPGAARPALEAIDLTLRPGEIVGVVGGNEGGKSTLCLLAAGLAPVTLGGRLDGRVAIDDVPTTELRAHELARRVGTLFQNPSTQFSGTARTVYEEVAFGPRNLGLSLREIVGRVEQAIGSVGIGSLAARDPARLSGGQAQLVALASVLAMAPPYLVLDEPTSQLDPHGTQLVGEALRRLAAEGVGLLLAEHRTDLLAHLAHRVAVVSRGRIVREGPASSVLAEQVIEDVGVESPTAVRLSRALEANGLPLDTTVLAAIREAASVSRRVEDGITRA